MNKNTIKKNRIRKDCWNLDLAFYSWMKERLPIYLKDAGKIVNLEYYNFIINKKTYTQKEVIKLMMSDLETLTSKNVDNWSQEYDDCRQHFLECFIKVLPYLWW